MSNFPPCHWRKEINKSHRCDSPIVGVINNLESSQCHQCSVRGHFDTDPVLRKLLAPVSSPVPPPGGVEAEKIYRIRLPGGSYQGSLLYDNNRFLLAYRKGWEQADIMLTDLGTELPKATSDITPYELHTIEINHPRITGSREDPRLFLFSNLLHISFNGTYILEDSLHSDMMLCCLSSDNKFALECWKPYYGKSQIIEKNWQYFEFNNSLCCVYSIEPHIILRMDGVVAREVYKTSSDLAWDWGHIRGGAPPVLVGDEFYHFFHGQVFRGDKCIYTCGVYTFEARPPFTVKRFAQVPVLVPPFGETSPQRSDLQVIFPCGAVLRDKKWYISYGHNDSECRIAVFDFDSIEKLLEVVTKKPKIVTNIAETAPQPSKVQKEILPEKIQKLVKKRVV